MLAGLTVAGCAASPRAGVAGPLPESAPSDLTFEVRATRSDPAHAGAQPSPVGRFVLLADGVLRYSHQGRTGSDLLPGRAVQLSLSEVDQLWRMVREMIETGRLVEGSPEQADVTRAAAMPFVQVRAMRRTWTAAAPHAGSEAPATLAPLIEMLSSASGRDVDQAAASRAAPRRSDFGPDPYAMYRRPRDGSS
jgi:hypothetical protein